MFDRLGIALLGVLVVFALGRFAPGVWTWGFSHLAYLPMWVFGLWLVGGGLMFWPRGTRALNGLLTSRASGFLLGSKLAYPVVATAAGLLFFAFGRHTHFLGDGTWLAVNVESGQQFHFFDFVDYRLHVLAYRIFGERVSADMLYRVGSMLAGVVASVLHLALVRRLPWPEWRRTLAYLLLFSVPPVVLYFGYVESYSLLFVALTAFLISGILVTARRFPLWGASAFYGAGLLLHLSALFTLPALLCLGWIAPQKSSARRAVETFLPPLLFVVLAVFLYAASGYDMARFEREFLHSDQGQSIFLPLVGDRGILSVVHFKDLFNSLFLTAPACVVVCVFFGRRIWGSVAGIVARAGRDEANAPDAGNPATSAPRRRGGSARDADASPDDATPTDSGKTANIGDTAVAERLAVVFLTVQIVSVSLVRFVVEAKLGGAKDWDLIAAQSAGLPLLAALLIGHAHSARSRTQADGGVVNRDEARPRLSAALLLGVSFLTTAPWVLLQSFEDRSISRLIQVTADSPPETRTYNLEEVGRYYRDRKDYRRAIPLYEECVRRSPTHPRLRAQLGTLYYLQQDLANAESNYREALRLDPDTELALQMLGEIELGRENPAAALPLARRLSEVKPDQFASWEVLARSALAAEAWGDAVQALSQMSRMRPDPEVDRQLGLAQLRAGDPGPAATSLRRAIRAGSGDPQTRLALAWALLESVAASALPSGAGVLPGDRAQIDEAEEILRGILRESPGDPDATEMLVRVQALRG